jgi:isoquinoline 1-oxidoreductase beta subunit
MLPIAARRSPSDATRRGFFLGAAALSGGLVLGFTLPSSARAQAAGSASPFEGYVAIARDGRVMVQAAHMEMGQGIHHGIGTLVAEELGVPLSSVSVEGAAGNPRLYGNITWGGTVQGTGGSSGTPSSWERYRRAGAAARHMLRAAAAQAWAVPIEAVAAADGILTGPQGQRTPYGEMAEAAARMAPPADPPLKAPSEWTLIGRDGTARIAGRDKATGRQIYTIDVRLPGMLTAVVAHPPRFGATVRSFDTAAARAVRGVVDVVQIPRGVAVVADTTWAAMKGREALTVEWDDAAAERRGTAELLAAYRAQAERDGTRAAMRGDADAALATAGAVIEAIYEFPYLAHAALEPLNAVVRRTDDTVEIWAGHQLPDLYQAIAAQIAGVSPDNVRLHVMTAGGGFGRRAVTDADIVAEATEVAKAIGWRAPVRVQWTREDDMAGGRYRPLYVHRVRAALGPDGRIAAWKHHIVGQSILTGTPFESMLVKDGVDATSVEGANDTPYLIPNLRVDVTNTQVGIPVLWWRSVGHTHTAYAVETMMDDLARAAGQDPIAFRLAHLPADARERGVLELVRDRSGWGGPLPDGTTRGIAVHGSFGTTVAMACEVAMAGTGAVKVRRVVAAVDCGVAINPDVIRAQVEGGVGFGLGAALSSELTLTDGVVDQTNYDGFQILRLEDMPQVEVHILPSTQAPTGIGEPGVPPIAPAVANAIAAATGRPVRILPIAKGIA